jgi:hypothetical protein
MPAAETYDNRPLLGAALSGFLLTSYTNTHFCTAVQTIYTSSLSFSSPSTYSQSKQTTSVNRPPTTGTSVEKINVMKLRSTSGHFPSSFGRHPTMEITFDNIVNEHSEAKLNIYVCRQQKPNENRRWRNTCFVVPPDRSCATQSAI